LNEVGADKDVKANDFQFAHHAPGQTFGSSVGKPTPKKSKRATGGDLFASTEADFFGFSKKGGSLMA
jgi:hypothetical protein